MQNARLIEERAAAFLARRDSGEWTEADQANLAHWLEGSIAHRVEFLRLEAVWEETQRLKAITAGLAPGVVPSAGRWRLSPFFRPGQSRSTSSNNNTMEPGRVAHVRWTAPAYWGWAAAAMVLLAVSLGAYLRFVPSADRYTTPVGGVASLPLQDGSTVTLNTATEVRVALTSKSRSVELDSGEAFFEVAKDPTRPFVVEAGDKRVIAVGTRFSVQRDGSDIRVAVTEGKVRVEDTSAPFTVVRANADHQSAPVSSGTNEIFLGAGGIARTQRSTILLQHQPVAEVEDSLSWRRGYLVFHNTTLADAVAEFNRYNRHQITIDDPTIAALRISGTFRSSNHQAFVRVLHEGFSIQATGDAQVTTLSRN